MRKKKCGGIISILGYVPELLCCTMGQVFKSFQPEVKIVSWHSCYVVNKLPFFLEEQNCLAYLYSNEPAHL